MCSRSSDIRSVSVVTTSSINEVYRILASSPAVESRYSTPLGQLGVQDEMQDEPEDSIEYSISWYSLAEQRQEKLNRALTTWTISIPSTTPVQQFLLEIDRSVSQHAGVPDGQPRDYDLYYRFSRHDRVFRNRLLPNEENYRIMLDRLQERVPRPPSVCITVRQTDPHGDAPPAAGVLRPRRRQRVVDANAEANGPEHRHSSVVLDLLLNLTASMERLRETTQQAIMDISERVVVLEGRRSSGPSRLPQGS